MVLALVAAVAGCTNTHSGSAAKRTSSTRQPTTTTKAAPTTTEPANLLAGIHKIRHIVVIMQENRSFDDYFGTYPGADGIPMKNGVPTVCVPDGSLPCVKPFPDHHDIDIGGPHDYLAARRDIAGGRMTGFVRQARLALAACARLDEPICVGVKPTAKVATSRRFRNNP